MPESYRRTIAELVTRYELEPDLRDLFVEGTRDYFLFEWFFRHNDVANVVIYSIASVNVPPELLQQTGSSGNKGRVVALCKELESKLPERAQNALGLVDKDYDHLLGISFSSRFLVTTDFSCLECYTLDPRTLLKFCALYLGKIIEADRLSDLLNIAVESFVLRAAKQALSGNARWIEVINCCKFEEGKIGFDRDGFIERLCNASSGEINQNDIKSKFSELREKTSTEVRDNINGHDIVKILAWFVHQIGVSNGIYNELPLQRALMASIEFEQLSVMPLFQRLSGWAES
jgi:uncharacterized protein DUF4435